MALQGLIFPTYFFICVSLFQNQDTQKNETTSISYSCCNVDLDAFTNVVMTVYFIGLRFVCVVKFITAVVSVLVAINSEVTSVVVEFSVVTSGVVVVRKLQFPKYISKTLN